MILYWLNTRFACGGIYVRDGIIVKTCPIYRRCYQGLPLERVLQLPAVIECREVGRECVS